VTTDIAEATQADAAVTQTDVATESTPDTSELEEARLALGHVETQGTPSTETPSAGTETQDDDLKNLLDANSTRVREEAAAKAREETLRETEEQARLAQARRQLDGIRQSFAQRANAIRAFGREQGWDEASVNRVVETFNSHHGQSVQVRDAEWWDHTFDYMDAKLGDTAKAIRADYEAGKIGDFHTLLDRITDAKASAAKSGHISEAEAKEREALAFIKGKRAAATPGAARTGLPQSRTNATSSAGRNVGWLQSLSTEEYEKVPVEERRAIWATAERG
jgi:uncharacterized protein YnzC (UPF0291/DUF896 family)